MSLGEGRPDPLGVTLEPGGANVAVFSAHATAIELCLFEGAAERRILLPHRTGDVFHAFVPNLAAGTRYGLRAHGPDAAPHGFNPDRLLIDPWALMLDRVPRLHPTMLPEHDGDSAAAMPLAVAGTPDEAAPGLPLVKWSDTVLYELHVRGFTMRHPNIPAALRGTFAGLAHPAAIGHLRALGVTTVELLPVAAWIEERHLARLGLQNHWGYNPVALMAPDPRLAPGGWPEIRACVAALAAAGIETVLDVVLNHTGEGDQHGPTLSLRGLDQASYYRFAGGQLANDTGCGNTLALDHPVALRLAMDALRAWARHGGVHGFRFDLAATMGRRAEGFDPAAPLLSAIGQDPLLSRLKMIAEPWDIGPGGYQLGRFPGAWGEWNDRYRDDVRRFWRGDGGMLGQLATRLAGSQDVFGARRRPSRSVNFITAHDGFTLADLVAYTEKHNHANAEDNRDGTDANLSWNNGTEGATDDPAIRAARLSDQRALLATILLSRGTPMLAMGSELGQTQRGNNNAYAQDNEISWLDWGAADADLLAWTARLIALRHAHPALRADRFLTGRPDDDRLPDVAWRGPDGAAPDWQGGSLLVMELSQEGEHLCLVVHRGGSPCPVTLPAPRDQHAWQLLADSAEPVAPPRWVETITAAARSVLLLADTRHPGRPRPADPALLRALADAAGIAPEWWEVDGTHHEVSPDTLRSLLEAMHLPAATGTQARESLAGLSAPRALPPALVRRAGQPLIVPIAEPDGRTPRARWLHIETDGMSRPVRLALDQGRVTLPELPVGRHRLWRDDAPDCVCGVTIAPQTAFLPEALERGRRFGVAAQLYTIRRGGDQGIGDFSTLRALAQATRRAGGAALGLNPLHALFPDRRERASPYYPSDRRFIDPIYLDLPGLPPAPDAAQVDYRSVWDRKLAGLEELADPPGLDRFIAEGGPALRRFAQFQAIAEVHPGQPWQSWPDGLRDPASPAVARFARDHAARIAHHLRVQALCDHQLAEAVRQGGLALGVIRDLAVGCAPDGAEAWALAGQLAQGPSIGAPPDPFSAEGQVWGLPPPIPHRMAEDGYASFATLLAANLRHAGGLRIDHVMGLARLFWVPEGGRGRDGAYVRYRLADLLGEIALASHQARAFIIGEDLGTVPEGFRETLAADRLLSYRVLLLERDGAAFRPAGAYPAQAVASVSTHDLPTFRGWQEGADIAERAALGLLPAPEHALAERHAECAALRAGLPDGEDLMTGAHHLIARTPSALALIQADDLAAEPMAVNLPGTDQERPNWRRRLAPDIEALFAAPQAQAILATMADRIAPPGEISPAA